MEVSFDAGSGVGCIACLQGSATLQDGGSATTLFAGVSVSLTQKGAIQTIQAFEDQPPGTNPLLWQVAVETWNK